jgi:hypothetical protein
MSKKKPEAKVNAFSKTILIFLGSLPVLLIAIVCAKLIRIDYVLNNHSFLNKDRHFSNVESTEITQIVSCANDDYKINRQRFPNCAAKSCLRHFSDFVLSQSEISTLLKYYFMFVLFFNNFEVTINLFKYGKSKLRFIKRFKRTQ